MTGERMMKKTNVLAAFVLVIGIVMAIAGCGSSRTDSEEDVTFLTMVETWYHYDEVTGENEVMRFGEDASFYWGCECGEPIDNSDLLESYAYDKEKSVIKFYNGFDDFTVEAEVLNYSDYHLLLKIDGEIKDYTYIEAGLDIEESEKYLSGYSGEFNTLGILDGAVVLGPFNHDGDVEYPDDAFMTCELAEDAEIYLLDINTYIRDGEVISHDVEYRPLETSETAAYMEQGTAFIWFDDELKITKILFYGEVIVEE